MPIPDIEVPLYVPADWLDDNGDDVDHLECCRESVALCGESAPGDYCDGHECGHDLCEVCERIDELGLSCGAPLCRVRRWWRMWRRSS